MLRTILVGLDGPPDQSSAVALGVSWARRFGAMLVGVGIVDESALRGPHAAREGGYLQKLQKQWVKSAHQEVDQLLEQLAIHCAGEGIACKLLEGTASPCTEIIQEAQRFDLIVLGTRTHFEAQRDSCRTLTEVLRHTPRPVVVVPESPPRREGPVMIAYDGSVQAARTLQLFAMTGLYALGEVYVVSLDPTDHVAAARLADRGVQFLRSHDIPARPLVTQCAGRTGQAILQQASELGAQLIVMGAYGRPRIEEFLLGSVTRHLLKESQVPLFMYH
jgi:nucleotide-binding universal stress UspA family protein